MSNFAAKNGEVTNVENRINRCTYIYWYQPWIEYSVTQDWYDIKSEQNKSLETTTNVSLTSEMTTTTKKPTTKSFYDAPFYDEIIMGLNPCDAGTILNICYVFEIVSLSLLVLI